MRFERFSTSNILFAGLLAALILLRVTFGLLPAQELLPSQESLLTWSAVLIITALALVGNYLARKTGFPIIWDTAVNTSQRLGIPALIGLALGLIWIFLETGGAFDVILPTLPTNELHAPLPSALISYPAGAIILEIALRLFALPLLLWLISNLLLGGRAQQIIFWLAAMVVAFIEPLGLVGPVLQSGGFSSSLALLFGASYLANLIFAYLFRRFGFLAPVLARLTFYLVWHILFANLI